jgi:carboxylesterase type B
MSLKRKCLMQFARTGNSNSGDLPQWPAVTSENEPTMIFTIL